MTYVPLIVSSSAISWAPSRSACCCWITPAAGLGDVRKIGSGNIGATNVLRKSGNKGLAAATLVLDMLKGPEPGVLIAGIYGTDMAIIAGLRISGIVSRLARLQGRQGRRNLSSACSPGLMWKVALVFAASDRCRRHPALLLGGGWRAQSRSPFVFYTMGYVDFAVLFPRGDERHCSHKAPRQYLAGCAQVTEMASRARSEQGRGWPTVRAEPASA